MTVRTILFSALALLLLAGIACGGGAAAPTAAQQPQQPAAAAQPAPAAMAAEPEAAMAASMPGQSPAPAPQTPSTKPDGMAMATSSGKDCRFGAPVSLCGEPQYGGNFRLAHRGDPRAGWDHMQTATYDNTHVSSSLTGSGNLVRSCRESVYTVCPGLAESWETSTDFTQWTFKIRDNVLWHDGVPFTAEDVKFWFDINSQGARAGDVVRPASYFRGNFKDLQTTEVLSGNRVRLTLGTPQPQYILGLGIPRMAIAHPKHLMQPFFDRGEVNVRPNEIGYVGTGPFVFKSFTKGSRAQVTRFDKYWEVDEFGKQMPYLDGIEWFIIGSPQAMDAAFRVGRLDGGARGAPYYPDQDRRAKYIEDMGDDVWFAPYGGQTGGWSFNVIKPSPVQDVRVRRAFALWLDKYEAIEALGGGDGEVGTILNPGNPLTHPDFLTWPGYNKDKTADRAEARRLLAEAGYGDGLEIDIMLPRRWVRQGEYINGAMLELGVTVKLNFLDEAAFGAARQSTDWHSEWGTTSGGPRFPEDASGWLNAFEIAPAARMKHQDPKVSQLISDMLSSGDPQLRTDLWRQLEEYMIVEQVYFVPTYSGISSPPYRSWVKGLPANKERVQEYLDFATIWLDRVETR
jgi:peptide/nickel transport system substrate-binding protein